jgi:N6-adenosine-specific RNA methylase IME4
MEIKIDQEFKDLIPPLAVEEVLNLEQSILTEGCREAIILWNGVIIDGHNRHAICTKHNLPFKTEVKEFASRNDVKIWMILNQFGRRNLKPYQNGVLALQLKNIYAEKGKENKAVAIGIARQNNPNNKDEQFCQISDKTVESVDTKKELAKIAGVSHDTIHKIETIKENTPGEALKELEEEINSGNVSINQAYKFTKLLRSDSDNYKKANVALRILNDFKKDKNASLENTAKDTIREIQREERDRQIKEAEEQKKKLAEQLRKEREEKEREERERLRKEREIREQQEKERLEKERIELEKERAEKEKQMKERLELERIRKLEQAKEEEEREKIRKEQAEKERIEKERMRKEREEQERIEQERRVQFQREQERIEKEKLEQFRAEQERIEAEKLNSVADLEDEDDKRYNVILCDPPWRYDFAETKNREIENQYPTMTLEEIKSLNVPADDDCVLFMWATAPKLEQAFEVLKAWGFTYKTCAVWDKELIGMGYWFRGQHELLLVGVRGSPGVPAPENRFSSVIKSRREGHSKKPECVYEMIEKMVPNKNYLEMFARRKRENWSVWGNQV